MGYLQPSSSDKAKLISRMAKMGQPMLPRGSIASHEDDASHEVRSLLQRLHLHVEEEGVLSAY